ncbi:IS5 family transposase IS468A [Streptomyces sp. RB17]|nr:IS5 family transposase IS468A [Streptomyces sp. RB17]
MRGMEREPYPSDLSDEQWMLIEPMITAWKQDRVARSATGDPGACDLREVVNAIFYQNRTGCQWRYLPHDLPAWSAVFYYFTLWRQDGLDQRIQELLRRRVREKARRLEDPSLVVLDTQSVRAAAGVPKTTTGLDANKKVSGRKRGLAVDVLGLVIGVEVVRRNPDDQGKGFVPQPKRWIVEQVNGTLMLHRRLAREYDHRPDTSTSRVYWASIANMTRRLTTPSPAWRDTLELAA